MPHLSKKKLKRKTYEQIDKLLINRLFSSGQIIQSKVVIESLLTETEKLMLAKRLAIIVLLDQGHSIYRIVKTLKVSPSTVARLHCLLATKYQKLCKHQRESSSAGFWDALEKILLMGMPPRVGKGRYRFLSKI